MTMNKVPFNTTFDWAKLFFTCQFESIREIQI